jgi:hypothetical protein
MAATHAHQGLVAVRAGVPDSQGKRTFSSGLLIAPDLVLTARHGVTGRGGAALRETSPLPGIEVSLVTGPRGASHLSEPVPATVEWLGTGGMDVALLELSPEPAAGQGPGVSAADAGSRAAFATTGLGWGEPIGTQPIAVTISGMPDFAAKSTGDPAEVETARGALEPGTYTSSDRYAVNLQAAPSGWQDWQGVSGSAVTCVTGGYLLGVVAWADRLLEGRRLTAVPVRALLADSGFRAVLERHLGRVPEVEPAELAPLLSRPQPPGSIGALLRPDAGLTMFTGREDELAFLSRWRDEPAAGGSDVKALLVIGSGGEGKTRLALEFLARSRPAGWSCGLLRQSADPDEVTIAAHPGNRLLLVIDYAAAKADGIAALARRVSRARPRVPVRLLLLARTAGDWWSDLAADLSEEFPRLEREVVPLGPLLGAAASLAAAPAGDAAAPAGDAAALFRATATALAPHLRAFTGRPAEELLSLAAALPGPRLAGPRAAHALTVQMSALAALLEAALPESTASGEPQEPAAEAASRPGTGGRAPHVAEPVEDTLLRHERFYRDRLAAQYGLGDLRPVRDRAVAGAALFGARGPTQPDAREGACSIVTAALPELDGTTARQREVATWIAGLYPAGESEPGTEIEYWGQVLPDRLGEFLAARILAREQASAAGNGGLLGSLAGQSDPTGVARALLILSRATDHDPAAADWIRQLVLACPSLAGPAAVQVATYAEHPAPLRAALVHLGTHDPGSLRKTITTVTSALPLFSLQLLESSASLTRELALVLRDLIAHNREAWLPLYSWATFWHSLRLAEVGRREEALPLSAQALTAYRALAARDPDTHLPDLVRSLNNVALRLSEAGQFEEALPVSAEAITVSRELADRDRDAQLPNLAMSLSNYSWQLAAAGRREEALAVSQEALTVSRQFTVGDRDVHLSSLAGTMHNHATRLAENGHPEQALPLSEEALTVHRELAARNRDAYLPDLALSLDSHAARLTENGHPERALPLSEEALTAHRELAARNRDAYLPGLARALGIHAARLTENGHPEQALPLSEEALTAHRELAARNRDVYLPILAGSLGSRAYRLAEAGHREQAMPVSAEAVTAYRELAALNRDAHLPGLAASLNSHATRLADTGNPEQALDLSAEAVAAYRELAARDRDGYLPGLARSLDSHASRLAENGHPEQALPLSEEALTAWRELAARDRDGYLPALALSLYSHAARLTRNGHPEQALPLTAEAVAAYRELDRDRDVYLPGLAASLDSHAIRLAEAGQREQALLLFEEARTAYRELAARDRDGYLPDLVRLLSNYILLLVRKRHPEQALDLSAEAVAAYRELADRDRDGYLPGLAASLDDHAIRLTEAGHPEQALSPSRDALAAYRELAARDRGAHLPGLARSLSNHAIRLTENGHPGQALDVSAEAVTLRRELAGRDRDTHLSDFASSLDSHALRLAEAGQREQALPLAAEAVACYRELAGRDRGAHLPGLARALHNHALRSAEAGNLEQSLPGFKEALALRRELAARDRDAHLSDFAMALHVYVALTAAHGHDEQALPLSLCEEAVALHRELAGRDRASWLMVLVTSLTVLASVHLEHRRVAGAVAALAEAAECIPGLPAGDQQRLEPLIAAGMREARQMNAREAEKAFRRTARTRWPRKWNAVET